MRQKNVSLFKKFPSWRLGGNPSKPPPRTSLERYKFYTDLKGPMDEEPAVYAFPQPARNSVAR